MVPFASRCSRPGYLSAQQEVRGRVTWITNPQFPRELRVLSIRSRWISSVAPRPLGPADDLAVGLHHGAVHPHALDSHRCSLWFLGCRGALDAFAVEAHAGGRLGPPARRNVKLGIRG